KGPAAPGGPPPPCDNCTPDGGSTDGGDGGVTVTPDGGIDHPHDDGGTPPDGGSDGGNVGTPRQSPIIEENKKPGDTGLRPRHSSGQLAAFVDRTSYLPGDTVQVRAGAASATSVTWELWRMGYYGGAGARKVLTGGPANVPTAAAGVLEPDRKSVV